ncbi:Hypothetical predicted protein [Paramuricea clavata]|uniref:Uncharacterized protein n=1 Tax=Paramuricea clavata TaxID=317549 RepID=A0A6S7IAX2_PARCT|nr:Hypothetical predicted protein [Paramuricea clavata]
MSKTWILVTVLSIIIISKSDAAVHSSKSTTPTEQTDLISPEMMNTVKSTSKTIGSKLTELFLNHFLPSNSFTLLITNNMVKRRMIDPKIYLKNGQTVTPPSFMLPAAKEPYSGTKHIVLLENDPAGVLCYDSEPIAEDPNLPKAVSCVIFDAKEKQYAIYGQNEVITNEGLQELHDKFTKKSEPTIQPTKNKNGGFLFRDYEKFQMIAQLTTGGEVRQLHFEVFDSITSAEAAQKRVVIAIAGSVLLGSLSTLATFTFSRITADVGTTLTLENGSTENAPIVLEDPRWEQNGVKIQDIVPWRLAPKESCKLTFVGPFGSGERLKRSVIALSFKIQGTNDRVVLSIWWPKKLNFLTKDLNAYSVSWLRIPYSKARADETLTVSLQDFVKKADKDAKKFPTPVIQINNFQRYHIWQFPILNPLSSKVDKYLNVFTNMGDGRKNGMTVKVYTIPKLKMDFS